MSSDFFRVSSKRQEPVLSSRYSCLGLTDNPFPASPGVQADSPDPRENGSIYEPSIRHNEEALFDSLLIPRDDNPYSKRLGFVMDFATQRGMGIGKTCFLIYQKSRIEGDWGKDVTNGSFVLAAAYIRPIAQTRKFWDFVRQVAYALNDQNIIAKAVWRLRYLCGDLPDAVLSSAGVGDPASTIGNDSWLTSMGVNPADVFEAVYRRLAAVGVEEELAKCLGWYGHDARRFTDVYLRKRTDSFWRKQGTELVFDHLVNTFATARIDHAFLLVDEVEKIVRYQNNDERRAFIDHLRFYLFDGNCESAKRGFFRTVLTIHPTLQELMLSHWEASGLARFAPLSGELAQKYTVYFRPIENDMAETMVEAYLKRYRCNPATQSLHPFEQEAVVEALIHKKRVPGPMLVFLHNIVEHAANSGWSVITRDSVISFAQSQEPTEPVLDIENDKLLPPVKADLLSEGLNRGNS